MKLQILQKLDILCNCLCNRVKTKNMKIRLNYFMIIQAECMNQEAKTVNNRCSGGLSVNIFKTKCPLIYTKALFW